MARPCSPAGGRRDASAFRSSPGSANNSRPSFDLVVIALPKSCTRPDGTARAPAACTGSKGCARHAARFRKSSRLLRHADFQRVYKQGRRQFAAHMTVFFLRRVETARPGEGRPVSAANSARVGLTVGRALGGAVERNRIKRRLREALRENLGLLPVAVDVVINPKKSVLTADFAVLKDEIARALGQIAEQESRRE